MREVREVRVRVRRDGKGKKRGRKKVEVSLMD